MPIMMTASLNELAKREIKTLRHNRRTIRAEPCLMLGYAGSVEIIRNKKKQERHPFTKSIPKGSFHLARWNFHGKTGKKTNGSSSCQLDDFE